MAGYEDQSNGSGLDKLFSKMDAISSNSGGTWYIAELVYSTQFQTLQYNMASNLSGAGELFDQEWTVPFTSSCTGDTTSENWNRLVTACQAHYFSHVQSIKDNERDLSPAVGQLFMRHAIEFCACENQNTSWIAYVSNVLEKTGGISLSSDLGNDVASWASGKLWLINTAVLQQAVLAMNATHKIFYRSYGAEELRYIPAKISLELGSADKASAPYPLCANAECFDFKGSWQLQARITKKETSYPFSSSFGNVYASAFSANGELPLVPSVAASSAWLGGLNYFLPTIMNVWATNSPKGMTFDEGNYLWHNTQQVKEMAESGMTFFLDGAYVDNTGIMQAVAAGATVVTSYLNSCSDAFDLFNASSNLCFEEMNASAYFNDVKSCLLTSSESEDSFLESICFGTINATTLDVPRFGVSVGTSVRLNLICVTTTINLMAPNSDFPIVAGAITRTMGDPANHDKVDQLLDEFFLNV